MPTASTTRKRNAVTVEDSDSSDPFASGDEQQQQQQPARRTESSREKAGGEEESTRTAAAAEEVEHEKTIPKALLTRILHEFFAKDSTRLSKSANEAVGKYVDVFVREAVARAAVEKRTGFFEVEDLEKVAPQLLLDL